MEKRTYFCISTILVVREHQYDITLRHEEENECKEYSVRDPGM